MIFLFFMLGAAFGSYIMVKSVRRNRGEDYFLSRSRCDFCGNELKFYEIIPIFSYIFLGGRTNCCKEKINPIYPIFEFILGVLFSFSFYKFGLDLKFFVILIIIIYGALISVTDILYMDVYDFDIAIFNMSILLFRYLNKDLSFEILKPVIFIFSIFYLIYFLTKAMGLGDVYLSLGLGIISNGIFDSFMNFTYTFILGASVSLILIFTGIKNKKDYIPFGEFIVITILGVLLCKY